MFICGSCGAAFSDCAICWTHTDECENVNADWQYGIVNGILEVVN